VYGTARQRLNRPEANVGSCLLSDMGHEGAFAQLNRQEAHLDRMYLRASRRLQELQALRRNGLRHVIEEEQEEEQVESASAEQAVDTAPPASAERADEATQSTPQSVPQPGPAAPAGSWPTLVTHWDHCSDGIVTKQTSPPPEPAQEAA